MRNKQYQREKTHIKEATGEGRSWSFLFLSQMFVCQPLTSQADKTDGRSSSFEKLPSEHSLFARLYDLLATKPHNIGRWFGLAEQAINTIYSLAQAPDEICATVIKDLAKLLPTSGGDTEETPCASDVLGRLLFVLGHVSLKQLIHMELAQAEIQRRRQGTPTRSVDGKISASFSPMKYLLF